jgi:hypothetical protein
VSLSLKWFLNSFSPFLPPIFVIDMPIATDSNEDGNNNLKSVGGNELIRHTA